MEKQATIRDVARPESLRYATYINAYTEESTDTALTDEAYIATAALLHL